MIRLFQETKGLFSILAFISMLLLILIPAQAQNATQQMRSASPVISDAAVLEWNEIAIHTILPNGPPFTATRFMTITQLAVFEAVNSISKKYDPYLGTINAPPGASEEAAAIVAAHNVLVNYFPTQAAALDQRRDASLAAIADGQSKTDGMSVGAAAAAAMIADRTGDGSSPPMVYIPTAAEPYEWQLTPGCTGGLFKHWPNVRPFAIESASQFRAEEPPSLDSGKYANDFNELQIFGDLNSPNRPQDRTNVARAYAAAPGHWTWNYALLQIASTRNDDITDTARTMALMNLAMNDGFISVFDSKYFYKTWRPVTAIPRADEDGNLQTTATAFTPLINTPCFPGYPSAHGTGSGAARTILERTYGRFGHLITVSHPLAPGIVLYYTDLRAITDDIADARVFGGIHFRFDQEAGEKQGEQVGKYVFNHALGKARP
jgi:hypothetical protein